MDEENIGAMMFQRIVPSVVAAKLVGSSAIRLWEKLANWIDEMRVDLDDPGAFEWFRWLAETLEVVQYPEQSPVYEAHRDWKPTSLTPGI